MGKFKAIFVAFLLVAIATGGAFYGLNLVFQQQVMAEAERQLTGATQQLLNNLRVKSFETIQALDRAGNNEELLSALQATPGTEGKTVEEATGILQTSHDKLTGQVKALKKSSHATHLQIVNAEGRLLAQDPGDGFATSLKGLPVVKDCLMGIARDGVREDGNKVFLQAAAPVRGPSGSIVGCLLNSSEISPAMLKPMSRTPEIEVAYFSGKKLKASSLDKKVLSPLVKLLDSENLVRFGSPEKSLPLLIKLKDSAYLADSKKLSLGTGDQHLVTVLAIAPKFETLQNLQMKVFYGGGALLVLGLLLALIFSGNKDRKQLIKLHDAVKVASETGNSANILADDFSGTAHFLAIDLKRLLESKPKAAPTFRQGSSDVGDLLGQSPQPASPQTHDSEPEPDKLDFDGLLGDSAASAGGAAPLDGLASTPIGQPKGSSSAPKPAPKPEPAPAPKPAIPAPPKPVTPAPVPAGGGEDGGKGPKVEMPGDLASFFDDDTDDSTREVDAIIPKEALPQENESPAFDPEPQPAPKPSPIREASPTSAPPPTMGFDDFPAGLDLGEDEDEDQITSGDYRPDATVVAQVPDALLQAAAQESSEEEEEKAAPLPKPPVMPAPVPPPPVAPVSSGSPEDAHFSEVYDKFLLTKKQCGESLAGLTKEKFVEKLKKNTSDLKTRYNCSSVRFQVYVKNGKAALKATPIK